MFNEWTASKNINCTRYKSCSSFYQTMTEEEMKNKKGNYYYIQHLEQWINPHHLTVIFFQKKP